MHVAVMTAVAGALVMRTMTMLMFMMGQMFYWRLSAALMAHSIMC
jgi:hypothetical protein